MLDDMRINDIDLTDAAIGALENADEVAHLFATLGYNVDDRTTIPDIATLGLDTDDLRQQILRLELLAVDPVDEDIKIYLFEVRSVTAKLRNDIARRFRERPENALLVLTSDYETLDFVLLERVVTKSKSRGKSLQQVIRPIPLNVNRRNPEAVELRVLKRFSFTEEDGAYQWEKLRSAYMLAEWSEEYFNNRALFSDYYLKERLTDARLTPEWDEDVRPAGREAYKHIIKARKNFSRQPEATIRRGLYEPLFALLGFDFKVVKASTSDADAPDYELYSKTDKTKPIAVALTYVWNRNLDDVDTTREPEDGTPDEIPGAIVVSVLEKTQVPWVIVTNGKLWRLYSSTASNKATNYYEVDLEEAIAATDQITALKYWWLMFRQQSFTGFLDTLLTESNKYAKELGDRLKDDVFLKIFPQFAKGFITHMRAQGIKETDIDLNVVFSGTMTFLYRMMFILYAESLDLLPVSEERGYGEYSLYVLKRDLARVGGENETDAPDLLKKHYTTKSTTIYERLKLLFGVIDQGSADLNMPTYNGGLFSAENESGLFLEHYAIPDQFLMLGLDRLTRDEDDKTKKLVFIDFKSLGVRQLGSIYEGLLEFKLKIAAEALAVEKDGKREVYIPLKKAKKKDAAAAVARGEVYLENDKQERKATGSYYTPDYIVKYIVQHTVGPVLERKLAEYEPRLRTAQSEYRDYVKLVEARRKSTGKEDSPLTFWNSDAMMQLVDDCLNVRVLDPAMGSGHFLVEVVDFTSNKLIDFLNGWSENPVWAALDRIREDILADMERQHVTIDADKLTRVALLKRAVLKRCVYGVDLNLMAVELAKVSLWLDAFTLGAPLSFLDHHLKWGNSLIGSRVSEVQAALEGQLTLFSQSKFAGVMLATDLMQKVSYLSDNTVAQVQASQSAYRNANDHLAPYKRVLDVYTSRWFGNAPIAGRRGAQGMDITIEFLKRDDTQAWLEDPRNPKNRLPADDYMKAGLVAKTALQAADDKRFFHWELEFPEVFFAPSTPGGQDVKLREDGGFDGVVGNPPYDEFSEDAVGYSVDDILSFFEGNLYSQPALDNRINIYRVFVARAVDLVKPNGQQGFVVPMSLLADSFTYKLRNFLLSNFSIRRIDAFPQKDDPNSRIFADAKLSTCIYVLSRSQLESPSSNDILIVIHPGKDIDEGSPKYKTEQKSFAEFDPVNASIPLVSQAEWALCLRLAQSNIKLGDYATAYPGELMINAQIRDYLSEAQNEYEIIRGAHINPYFLAPVAKQGEDLFLLKEKYLREHPNSEKAHHHKQDRVVYQRYAAIDMYRRLIATIVPAGNFCSHTVGYLWGDVVNPYFLLGLFNSKLLDWRFSLTSTNNNVNGYELESIPIPRIDFATPADDREHAVNAITAEYANGRYQLALQRSATALAQGQTDVVHDVLAHLAGQMIDLNQQKQAEVNRFLVWLEGRLQIAPKNDGSTGIDSLTGKTSLQGYLGDYQKGKPEVSWQDFFYRLHQNRNRFGVALSSIEAEIEREYAASLKTLLPIKDQLAKTDALIDKIVYQLYGLTAAEIELIERPGYEQALADAKTDALKDKTLPDEEATIDKIAEGILPAAQRFFERVDSAEVETVLDGELPNWRALPPDAPTFLLTGDYNLRSLPDHMDFSSSVIPYTKAVEVALHRRIFEPFRASYRDSDCRNDYLREFMQGRRELTLGSYMIILSSARETALRGFVGGIVSDVEGLATTLNDAAMRDVRNKAAHDEVISRDEAGQARTWALIILGQV
ncbi:MAG: Eco57I restriction-modification methylase domain-containing protein [Anaerolineae bacterium]|nr:Eco57I restriction-modification methylase domain-containing protein [Anaerolineae bacterium]